jgi:AcrR family transcriptional regulator
MDIIFSAAQQNFNDKKQKSKKRQKNIKANNRTDQRTENYSKALDLFVEKGYDATSSAMISKRLGISKANLYYYFPSKEGLLYQIHPDYMQKRFIPIIEGAEKLSDPKDRLILFLRSLPGCVPQVPPPGY